MKKTIVLLSAFVLAIALSICALVSAPISAEAATARNYQQTESPWGYAYYDGYTFASSGCGIMSTVNAVNYVTGNWINPLELANWANARGLYTGTDGTYRSMWSYLASSSFPSAYGFKIVSSSVYGTVYDSAFRNHIANGGVAVVHVKGHYMSIVDYNASTGQYLLWDNAAGPVCGYKRPTSTDGDWCTAAQLEGSWNSTYLTVDWYCLISSTSGSSANSSSASTMYTAKTSVASGSGKVGFNDDCSKTSVGTTAGTTVYFRVTPSSGYRASKVVVGGTAFTLKNNGEGSQVYTFAMPKGDVSIVVTFTKISYKVSTTVDSGLGKAGFNDDCSYTSQTCTQGTTVYFRVTPADGYVCSSVIVGGTAFDLKNGGVGSQVYSFAMPAGAVSINVAFTSSDGVTRYSPVLTKTGSGSVTFTPSAYEAGETVKAVVKPSSGYYVAAVKINGKTVPVTNDGEKATYTFKATAKNTPVVVKFVKVTSTDVDTSVIDDVVKMVIFDATYYADRYADLKAAFGYNETALWDHFINFGVKEGRRASKVFDVAYYAEYNYDLWEAHGYDYAAQLNHFAQFGIKEEGRLASADFHVKTYKAEWADLRSAYGTDIKLYYRHYVKHGMAEGRKCV